MSDAAESRVDTPFPSDPPPASAAPDALAGDWSEGLRKPLHTLALKKPRLLGSPEPIEETPAAPLPQATEPMPEVRTEQADLRAILALKEKLAAEAAVDAPEAWAVAEEDQLASNPPPLRLSERLSDGDESTTEIRAAITQDLLARAEAVPLPAPDAGASAVASAPPAPAAPASTPFAVPTPVPPIVASEPPAPVSPHETPAAAIAQATDAAPPAPVHTQPPGTVVAITDVPISNPPAEAARADDLVQGPGSTDPTALPVMVLDSAQEIVDDTPAEGAPPHVLEAAAQAAAIEAAPMASAPPVPEVALAPSAAAHEARAPDAPAPGPAPAAQGAAADEVDEDLANTVISFHAVQPSLPPIEDATESLPDDAIVALPDDAVVDSPEPLPDVPWETAAPAPAVPAEAWSQATAIAAAPAAPPTDPWPLPAAAAAPPVSDWTQAAPSAEAAPATDWAHVAPAAAAPVDDWLHSAPAAAAHAAAAPAAHAPTSSAPAVDDWTQSPAAAAPEVSAPPAPSRGADATPIAPVAEPEWTAAAPVAPPSDPWAKPHGAATSSGNGWAIAEMDVPMESLPPPASGEPLFAPLPPGATLSDPDAIVGAGPRDTDPDSKPLPLADTNPEGLPLPADTNLDLPPILAVDDPDLLVPVEEPGDPIPTGPLAMVGEHRVAVHTRAGRVRRGIARDVDLAAASFKLHPQSGGGYETVKAEEIKAVFFMLAAGERPPHATGRRVKVMFADGRSMAGARDGEEGLAGFFFIPDDAARTNTRRVFVSRAAANDIIDA